MQYVDNAHLDLSADRPPFHTPDKMIALVSINREKVIMIMKKRGKQKKTDSLSS